MVVVQLWSVSGILRAVASVHLRLTVTKHRWPRRLAKMFHWVQLQQYEKQPTYLMFNISNVSPHGLFSPTEGSRFAKTFHSLETLSPLNVHNLHILL